MCIRDRVLELHLSLASKVLGFNVATPVFNGADENDIMDTLEMANDYANKTWEEFEERWGDKVNDDIMKYLWDNRDHKMCIRDSIQTKQVKYVFIMRT